MEVIKLQEEKFEGLQKELQKIQCAALSFFASDS
eukprot:SAG11_NODE_220_length_12154_cov_92.233347_3_plen_34_part_00